MTDECKKISWGIIATWRMAMDGVAQATKILGENGSAGEAVETAIKAVEDCPLYKSVGYGGLPNEEMEVEMDAAFMNGDTLGVGAVAAIKDVANPIAVARSLSNAHVNCVLVGEGAMQYAEREGFARKQMLTEQAKEQYHKRLGELAQKLTPYDGHDTVGVVCLDSQNTMAAATSTSGLFMKKRGRVGDSPLVGSGFYADSAVGGASATGLGEDLMKGCISYEITRLMEEGMHPQQACETAVNRLDRKLRERRGEAGDLSVVAMNANGEWGAATNIQSFAFVVATSKEPLTVYRAKRGADGHCQIEQATKEWIEVTIDE